MLSSILWFLGTIMVIEYLLHAKNDLRLSWTEFFAGMNKKAWAYLLFLVFLWPLAMVANLVQNSVRFVFSVVLWWRSRK